MERGGVERQVGGQVQAVAVPLGADRVLDVMAPLLVRLRAGGRIGVAGPAAAGGVADGLAVVRRAGELVGVAMVAHGDRGRVDRAYREAEEERLVVAVRIPVVQAFDVDLGAVVGLPLQRVVEFLARAVADVVVGAEAVGHGDEVAFRGADGRAAGAGEHLREIVPYGVVGVVLLVVTHVDQRAELAEVGFPAVAQQQAAVGVVVVAVLAVRLGEGGGRLGAVEVERAIQLHVHHAGDAAVGQAGLAGLVDLHGLHRGGRQVLERECAAHAAEDLAAVQGGDDVGQAADHHRAGLALEALRDLHAGDALHGVGHAVVGQLADVLGHDRIDDHARVLLDRLRALQAFAQRRHHHAREVHGVLRGGLGAAGGRLLRCAGRVVLRVGGLLLVGGCRRRRVGRVGGGERRGDHRREQGHGNAMAIHG